MALPADDPVEADEQNVGAAFRDGWPSTLQPAVLNLPTSVTTALLDNAEEIQHPWAKTGAPRVSSSVIDYIRGVVTGAVNADAGLALITGGGLADLSDNLLAVFHLAVAHVLGDPVGQNGSSDILVEVCATDGCGTPIVRGYQDAEGMLLHSDAADFAGLMCLTQADVGGTSLFASALTVHDILAEQAPELLPEYYRDWYWNVGALGFSDVRRPIKLPIFSVHHGRLSCRYSSSLLRGGAIQAGQVLTHEQTKALDLFEEIALRDSVVVRYRLKRGESVWMNNQSVLHGRDAFRDGACGSRGRRLLRAWSRSKLAHQRWPRVAAFDDHLFHRLEA